MYSSSLDFWYKKNSKDTEKQEEIIMPVERKYSLKELKFGMRTYMIIGIALGNWMGYMLWV